MSLIWSSWPQKIATHAGSLVAEPTWHGIALGRGPRDRLHGIREAHEHAAVAGVARARVAPLQLEREVAVVLDRVPRHAQAAGRAGEAAVLIDPVEPARPGLRPLARSAAELRIVSSSTYGFHSPPSTRISVELHARGGVGGVEVDRDRPVVVLLGRGAVELRGRRRGGLVDLERDRPDRLRVAGLVDRAVLDRVAAVVG